MYLVTPDGHFFNKMRLREAGFVEKAYEALPWSTPQDSVFVLIGGHDVRPHYEGVEREMMLSVAPKRTYFELNTYSSYNTSLDFNNFAYLNMAIEKGIRIFAICRGHQLLAVSQGGKLYQDIGMQVGPHTINGSQWHSAYVNPEMGAQFYIALHTKGHLPSATVPFNGQEWWEVPVNTYHHQAVRADAVPANARVTMVAAHQHQIVEGLFYSDIRALSVQQHPEYNEHGRDMKLIQWLIDRT